MNANVKDHLYSGAAGFLGAFAVGAFAGAAFGASFVVAGVLVGALEFAVIGGVVAAVASVVTALAGTGSLLCFVAAQKKRVVSLLAGAAIGAVAVTPSLDYSPLPEELPKAPVLTASFSGAANPMTAKKAILVPALKSAGLRA